MDPLQNPFSPGAGNPPPELAGRDELLTLAQVMLGRVKAGRYEQSLMLVGLRGVGKTVLLNRIRDLAESQKYGVVLVETTESRSLPELLIPALRGVLIQFDKMEGVSSKVKMGLRVLRSFIGSVRVMVGDIEMGLSMDPEKGKADSGDFETDLSELFVALGEAAKERRTAIAIIIDEIQYLSESEMSALIMAIHRVSQRQLPLVLVAAGLPQLVGLAGRSKSYAERLFQYPAIGPLTASDAMAAVLDPVKKGGVAFTEDALKEIMSQTKGYPYFLQEWGYQAWNLAAKSPIDKAVVLRATVAAIKKLDESFFRVRFDRLTPREKDYLRALAELGPGAHRSGDVADLLGVKVQSIAPLRSGPCPDVRGNCVA
ncbi:MAG: AAA family ATPase [Elusimicrobia bacterium]|nr:AAA family ATPase [Elusimicrobiota bacterium]